MPRTTIYCFNPNCLKLHGPLCLRAHQNFRVHKPAIHLLPAFFSRYFADHSIKRKIRDLQRPAHGRPSVRYKVPGVHLIEFPNTASATF